MATFQNTTLHPIPIVINGVRKMIRPGEQFSGPENMSSIPGISLLSPNSKTVVVPSQNTVTEKIQNIQQTKLQAIHYEKDISGIIEEEIKYLKHMKEKGDNPSVSIAILTKNRHDLITNCCESIFKEVNYKNTHIVIIDTGTTDQNVRDYYNTLQSKCDLKGWKYKFIQLTSFHYSKNYNEAIFKSIDTDYVLIQNNDTVALNDYVTKMMQLAVIKKVGSVGCRMLYPDRQSIQHDGQVFYNGQNGMLGSAGHVNLRQIESSIPKHQSYTHLVDGNTAAGCLLRTEDFKKVQGFDENYGDIFQDVDLMAKIPHVLNKFNYCNRQARIIHVDNASRLQSGVDQKKHIQMWEDTHYMRKKFIENKWNKVKLPEEVDFSIITTVYDIDAYIDLVSSLSIQLKNYKFEIIAIPNFYNIFNSAFDALNAGIDIASGKVLIMTHDDIIVSENWIQKIKNSIISLENRGIPIGVLGPAGIGFPPDEKTYYYLLDENNHKLEDIKIPFQEVQTLDELCLITLKKSGLRFDNEKLSGWHFYGPHLCLKARSMGLKNFAIEAWCHHKSDGYKNLSSQEKYNSFVEKSKEFDAWAKSIGIQNWRSTTVKSINNLLHIYPKPPSK